jgi:hypothetical protein
LSCCWERTTDPTTEGGGLRIWLATSTLDYPVDGYLWFFVNWAHGLRSAGCDLVWLENVEPDWPEPLTVERAKQVKPLLDSVGVVAPFAVTGTLSEASLAALPFPVATFDHVSGDDVLLSLVVTLPSGVVDRFRRSALVEVDPGITQGWIRYGAYDLPDYGAYFTIGEGVPPDDAGYRWQHTFPCVALDLWPPAPPSGDAAFTTVTHWWPEGKWFFDGERLRPNGKRHGFLPYLDLPRQTRTQLELAMPLALDDWPEEHEDLRRRGWRLRDSAELAAPGEYRRYIQGSLGEFSCAKPAYVELGTGWLSDRTVCYLASGKPAVVQHTGASRSLPDREGLLRFRDPQEALVCLEAATDRYEEQCRAARALAEELFDATKVASSVLERTV